jgi:hypothetical protein
MNMRQFLDTYSREAIVDLAWRCGTKVIYLRQIACGAKRPSPQLARLLDEKSGGVLARENLRPDVFGALIYEQ